MSTLVPQCILCIGVTSVGAVAGWMIGIAAGGQLTGNYESKWSWALGFTLGIGVYWFLWTACLLSF